MSARNQTCILWKSSFNSLTAEPSLKPSSLYLNSTFCIERDPSVIMLTTSISSQMAAHTINNSFTHVSLLRSGGHCLKPGFVICVYKMTLYFTKYLNTCDKVCVSSETIYNVLAYFHRKYRTGSAIPALDMPGLLWNASIDWWASSSPLSLRATRLCFRSYNWSESEKLSA